MSELLDRVQAGEQVIVTRHGRPVAHIIPASPPRQPLDLAALSEFRRRMPRLRRPSAELLRESRDDGL